MKAIAECYDCLARLLHQAADNATSDRNLRSKAIDAGMFVLDANFSTDGLTIDVATKLHRVVREVTGNPDPYLLMKEREIELSRKLVAQVGYRTSNDFKSYLSLSLAGNAIDFFRDLEQVKKDIEAPITFAVDDSAAFERMLREARTLMFLADNA
ncbi:MAG: ARMT1-like domain-containing protein, partial [Dehalococcoidia bacterium]